MRSFDGATTYAYNGFMLSTPPIAIGFWALFLDYAGVKLSHLSIVGADWTGWYISLNSNSFGVVETTAADFGLSFSASGPIPLNTWNHYYFEIGSNSATASRRAALNGVFGPTNRTSHTIPSATMGTCFGGAYHAGTADNLGSGRYKDAWVSDILLTPDQLRRMVRLGPRIRDSRFSQDPPVYPPYGAWRFYGDIAATSAEPDYSLRGFAKDLTIVNSAFGTVTGQVRPQYAPKPLRFNSIAATGGGPIIRGGALLRSPLIRGGRLSPW